MNCAPPERALPAACCLAGLGVALMVAYHAGVRLPLPGADGDLAWIGADLCLVAWGFLLAQALARGAVGSAARLSLRLATPMLILAAICTLCAWALPGEAALWVRQHLLLLWLGVPDWAVWADAHPWQAELWPWRLGATWLCGAVLASGLILTGGSRFGRAGIALAAILVLVSGPVLRWTLHEQWPERALGVFGPLRLDAAAAGALLALWRPWPGLTLAAGGLALLALLPLAWLPGGWHWSAAGMAVVGCTLIAILAWAMLGLGLAWRRPWRTLTTLGAVAGPCYLAHGPLIGLWQDVGAWQWLRVHGGTRAAAVLTALVVLVILLAAARMLRRWRLSLRPASTACCCLLAASLPSAESDIVAVDGLRLRPGGNLGSADERLRWHPKAALSGLWDSNPGQNPEARSDQALRWLAGADLCWDVGEAARVDGSVQVSSTDYRTFDQGDFTAGSLRLAVTGQGEVWRPSLRVSALRADDPLVETGRSVIRNEYDAEAALKRTGERTTIGVGLVWYEVDYERATYADRRDRRRQEARLLAERATGDRLILEALLQGFAVVYRSDVGPYQDAVGLAATAGVRLRPRERLVLTLHLGAELRQHGDDFAGDPAYADQRVVAPVGEALAAWEVGEGGRLRLRVAQNLVEGSTANTASISIAGAGGDLTLAAGQFLRADATWTGRRDDGAPAAAEVASTSTLEFRLGGVQPLGRGLSLTAELALRQQDGSGAADYTQFWARAGLAWAW